MGCSPCLYPKYIDQNCTYHFRKLQVAMSSCCMMFHYTFGKLSTIYLFSRLNIIVFLFRVPMSCHSFNEWTDTFHLSCLAKLKSRDIIPLCVWYADHAGETQVWQAPHAGPNLTQESHTSRLELVEGRNQGQPILF